MQVQLGRFRMTLRLWPTAVVATGLAILLTLGTWQLQRGMEKRQVLAQHQDKTQRSPIVLHADRDAPAELLHLHPVAAIGNFDGERTMLLDNRLRDGQAGYEVLVPLRLQGSDSAVLVNRGWLARGALRSVKPDVTHPVGQVGVKGIAVQPAASFRLGDMLEPQSNWPHIVQFVAIDEMQALLGYRLLPVVLRLADDDPAALRTGWPIVVSRPERHYAYAVQWYGIAVVFLVIYLAACTRRDV